MHSFGRTLIRLGTALIPVKSVRKRIRRRLLDAQQAERLAHLGPIVAARYAAKAAECRAKLARGERLRVSFLVCDASMFSGESLYLKMKDDPRFVCTIDIAPRVTRGEAFLAETLAKTMKTLGAKYGEAVKPAYDPSTKAIAVPMADLVFSTIIYEDQSFPEFTVERLSEHALVSILYYGYGGLFKSNEKKTPFLPNIVLAWRYFVSNGATRDMNVARNPALARNIRVSGYCKMDRMEVERLRVGRLGGSLRRKKIILSPHHTIDKVADGALALSTFLTTADTLLALPAEFPEVDFVFRPHPLLFVRLAQPKWWGPERTAAYKAKMESYPNVEFQQGGDYFATFADSDALIHDCGSFLAEYFYTGKPQCYLLESDRTVEEQFLPFSKRLLEHVTKAYTGADIRAFVKQIAAGAADPNAESRAAFAAEEVCVNHPHATEAVLSETLSGIEKEESGK